MIVGTYYIEDTLEDQDFIDHLGQVERLAAEGSTSSWMDVKELTPEVRERLMSKVLGYYEIPAPKGTKKAVIQLGFPTAAWDVNVNVPMLLLSIAGNCFAFPTKMRLLDIYIPEKLAQKFQGPKFGIPGVRKILGVYDRPLTLQIIKPKMGMTPEETANQVYQSALGGADLCKDDEMCTELANCSFEARLEAVLKALEEGRGQDRPQDALHGQHHRRGGSRPGEGAQGVRDGRDRPAAGLLGRAVGAARAGRRPEDHGADPAARLAPARLLPTMNFPSLAKICRLCGADMMLTPSIWSSIPVASTEECLRVSQTLHAPFYHIKPIFPMPGAGIYPGAVPPMLEENGPDMIFMAGGGMLGHPMGYTAGAIAFRQAIDAAMAGIPLDVAAQDKPELMAALKTWGLRKRPVTRWGFSGEQFHPKFAEKGI